MTYNVFSGTLNPTHLLTYLFAIGARVALLWQHYGNEWQSPAVIRQAHRTPHVYGKWAWLAGR